MRPVLYSLILFGCEALLYCTFAIRLASRFLFFRSSVVHFSFFSYFFILIAYCATLLPKFLVLLTAEKGENPLKIPVWEKIRESVQLLL
jgi:hypothetical protein